jgi:hypothetical protein
MRRTLISLLGVAGLLAALAPPAIAQDSRKDWVWHSDGKRYWRTEEVVTPFVMPTTTTIEVAPGDQKEGDVLGSKYAGKRLERVYFREVPRQELAKGHECSWRMKYVGKTMSREEFCVENGVEQPYGYAHHGVKQTREPTVE